MMTFEEISGKLSAKFAEKILAIKNDVKPDAYVLVSADAILEVAKYLRDEENFDFLNSISGIDLKGKLGAVYHISSIATKDKIVLRVEVENQNPIIPSVESIWKTANWHEREAFDLIGIVFSNHPDLRRILLPYDWEGHPLKKDYQVPEFYNGMKVPY